MKSGVENLHDISVGQTLTSVKRPFTERNMILSILWEGDLEIHTNKELMSDSTFGQRIVHGDAVTTMVAGLLFHTAPFSSTKWNIEILTCSYQQPVFIDDVITGIFTVSAKEIINTDSYKFCFDYQAMKNGEVVVSTGTITIVSLFAEGSLAADDERMELTDYHTTPGKTVTMSDLALFQELIESADSDKKELKVPKPLLIMIAIGLMNRKLPLDTNLIAVLSNSWSFKLPVYVDDTLKVNYKVIGTKMTQKRDKEIATYELHTFNQHAQQVAEGKWTILLKSEDKGGLANGEV